MKTELWRAVANAVLCCWFLSLAGCGGLRHQPEGQADAQFRQAADEFLNAYLAWRPQTGTSLGLHEYDGKVTDLSRASLAAERERLARARERFEKVNPRRLSPEMRLDCEILKAEIARELFKFDDQQVYTENPMTYAGILDLNIYIKRNFAPLEDRVRSIIAIEKTAPRSLAAARENLAPTLARPLIETAIEVANGAADFLERDLTAAVKEVKDDALLREFHAANTAAMAAMRGYADWLRREKLPTAHERIALGAEKYRRMLRSELIDKAPEAILEQGQRELRREQAIFAEAAREIDPGKSPIEVFKAIQKEHPTEHTLLPETRRNLEAIRQFVVDRKLVTIPSEVRVGVEETPAFARATSFASMDTPGPFETKATEAYYYVTPVEPDWPPARKEEWLTAFNYYTTDIVSIHEAYPGHYTQFLCLNASPVSRLRKIISSYAFTEGWAHYTEQMLIEQGFGKPGPNASAADRLKAAKYRLAQSDEALLRLCRLCVSIQVHCQGMSLDEATKFFQDNCYYEPAPAKQEATRAAYDPGYLYYTYGKLMLLELREVCRTRQGKSFSLQRFHDDLLRHGMPPVPLLREVFGADSVISR